MPCTTDADCPQSQVCYSSASWFIADQPNDEPGTNLSSSTDAGCLCSGWYGWSGPQCDQLGAPEWTFWVVSSVLVAIAFLGLSTWTLNILFRIQMAHRLSTSASTKVTLVQIFVAGVCMVVFEAIQIAEVLYPTEADEIRPPSLEKSAYLSETGEIFYVFGVLLSSMSAANIAATYIELALAAQTLKVTSGHRFKLVIYCFETVFLLVLVINLFAGLYSLSVIVAVPFALIILVAHLFGVIKLRRYMHSDHNELERMYIKIMNEIFMSSSIIVAFLCLVIFLGIGWTVVQLQGWKEIRPGLVQPSVVLFQLIFFALFVVDVVILRFLRKLLIRPVAPKVVNVQMTTYSGSFRGAGTV